MGVRPRLPDPVSRATPDVPGQAYSVTVVSLPFVRTIRLYDSSMHKPAGNTPDSRSPEHPVITFLGAARTVTGSRYLIESPAGGRVLVDCGLFQGLKELRLRNWEPFPVDASTIDAVILTHAHIDHCGYLPALVTQGFNGPVYATKGTVDLARIVLPDSGHLQEEEASFANRVGYSKHSPALPLYTQEDAVDATRLLNHVPFGFPVEVAPGIEATFRPAGHILGSSIVTLDVEAGGGAVNQRTTRRVVFSGDLGRPAHPVLVAPDPVDGADVLLVESTYGDRTHDDEGALELFAKTINSTIERGGTVVIPAFAVDRTEVLLFHLRTLHESGAIPDIPIFVDSPMALAALDVYRTAISERSPDIRPEVHEGPDPFDAGNVIQVHDVEASKLIDRGDKPSIIISASGMATGGRVLHHLARFLPDRRSTVILVGFQAEQTRGRRLLEGARELKMLGRYVPVRAEVVNLPTFSIHADRDELIAWLSTAERPPETTFIVHGEAPASIALRDSIEDRLGWHAVVPRMGERVLLA